MGVIELFKKEDCILDPEWIVTAIHWVDFKYLLERLPYGHPVRVMTLMLAYTGCRVSELSKMSISHFKGNSISWKPGKNQVGMRRELLPDSFIAELVFYRKANKTNSEQLFSFNHVTFRTYFNRLRKQIGGRWLDYSEEALHVDPDRKMYLLQLKGFRKTFQTVLFKYYMEKYNDAGVALEMVSKRMRHSSEQMTAYHYIENYKAIDVDSWVSAFFVRKPFLTAQSVLGEYVRSTRGL